MLWARMVFFYFIYLEFRGSGFWGLGFTGYFIMTWNLRLRKVGPGQGVCADPGCK